MGLRDIFRMYKSNVKIDNVLVISMYDLNKNITDSVKTMNRFYRFKIPLIFPLQGIHSQIPGLEDFVKHLEEATYALGKFESPWQKQPGHIDGRLIDYEYLKEKWLEKKMTVTDLMIEMGCHYQTLRNAVYSMIRRGELPKELTPFKRGQIIQRRIKGQKKWLKTRAKTLARKKREFWAQKKFERQVAYRQKQLDRQAKKNETQT